MSLAESVVKIKGISGYYRAELAWLFLALIVLGVGLSGFFLGVLFARPDGSLRIFAPEGISLGIDRQGSLLPGGRLPAAVAVSVDEEGEFVASKQGTKYHRLDCPGAKSIKEANRVLFGTESAARDAGYLPAVNCPGLLP